ncbi:hypothetical protein PR202_ga27855 [Eleusine coracana subsp. coracana]|uniref:Pectinesterase inhibitor domain-containing protein n=1 Tax=Eleusine coracana subsp. coracana TaxID=191504 RepID=A0AAV5DH84_ELECO|nr:hypothetical protein PR202_ga27855 [Eleusine coracana subsp. coracana]
MADMARSLIVHLFFVLMVVASTASAARDLPEEATSALDEACDETRFPDLCTRSLLAYPDSRTAGPRRLAELSVVAALDAGRAAAAFAHDALVTSLDDAGDEGGGLFRCLDGCSADVEAAVAQLSALSREPTDARFLEVQAWLSATLGENAAAGYEAACRDAPDGEVKDAAVAKSVEFDMMLRVALDLIAEASSSMTSETDDSVALPPSERDAESPMYGGAFFPGAGAPSSYGHRRPRPRPRPRRAPAPAPSRSYGHRRPRPRAPVPAPAPSPSGGYGANMPLPRAPAPGYGHRRPRPRPAPPSTPAHRPGAVPPPARSSGSGAAAGVRRRTQASRSRAGTLRFGPSCARSSAVAVRLSPSCTCPRAVAARPPQAASRSGAGAVCACRWTCLWSPPASCSGAQVRALPLAEAVGHVLHHFRNRRDGMSDLAS